MLLEPKDLYEKLEFDKILDLLDKACYGELGKKQVRSIKPDTQKLIINRKMREVLDYKTSFEVDKPFPMGNYQEISKELKMLEVVDYVLPIEGLQKINKILLLIQAMFKFFGPTNKEQFTFLYDIVREITIDEGLSQAIERVIDEKGEIRPDASQELLAISRKINGKRREMDKQFKSIITEFKNKGWLTDNVESFRNGRRVLSVPAEHKRKIRGIIHDESATGKTAFIEPESIIDINNDIFDLQQDEKKEIYRILKELSTLLRPYVPLMFKYQQVLSRFDLIQAKASLATRLNANLPKLKDGPHFNLKTAYHPLLFLKNKEIRKETVPFNLEFLKGNRILMLSGPNAGGKSITMKSVGLLQLMLQCGMLLPMDAESEIGIFQKIFADIGDQQSIEDDLSTYSSRLKNMKAFLEKADKDSLILIDEFGSGTDPKIGGAIAEAILDELNKRNLFGVITTHYSNLKMYAFKAKGIVNGSMTFDKDQLTPTYELKVGRPGSSYAFEIAEKSGLGKKIMKYAKHQTGANEKAVDELLVDLQREKKELEEQVKEMKDREKKLERLIRNYENMAKDLEFKRKKLKLEVKEQALQETSKDNKEMERLIRQLREEKNVEKAKTIATEIRTKRKELSKDVHELKEEIYYKPLEKESKKGPIAIGDFVKLKTGGSTGKVDSISKNNVIITMGALKMTVKLRDLTHANEPLDIKTGKSVTMDTVQVTADFESKIDIRGLRMEEALRVLELFVDKALISNVMNISILHGKGNGILRKAVKQKLREYDAINEMWHPAREQGGDGITLASFG